LVRTVRQAYQISEKRACGLMLITRWINRYKSRRDSQDELRMRLRELAGSRTRYGYRRLTVMLRREGWLVNTKRVPVHQWALVPDFDGVDQYTHECLCACADHSQRGEKVVEQMRRLGASRGLPESITTDNGSEFAGRAMETWAYRAGVKLDFIRPGKPVETDLSKASMAGCETNV
jgi:putative transposase